MFSRPFQSKSLMKEIADEDRISSSTIRTTRFPRSTDRYFGGLASTSINGKFASGNLSDFSSLAGTQR